MRIKKTSQTTTMSAQVVNTYSDSTEDTYSCDYNNKAFGGTILWTNESPTSNYTSGDITLSSDDYDMLLWIFKTTATGSTLQQPLITIKGFGGVHFWCSISVSDISKRLITYNTATSYTINRTTSELDSRDIPLYVIGYKTGLFS